MARSKSSKAWLREHHGDEYVQRSRDEGYRSRATYKLAEIQQKDRLLRPGQTVLDLGAAPGGWSEFAAREVGDSGRVLALDLLPMPAIAGVEFLQGDFNETDTYERLIAALGEGRADLVLSDMAPNMSGVASVDQPRSMQLAELALDLATEFLAEDGAFVVKLFQGEDFDALLARLKREFRSVKLRKPDASRSRSKEIYAVCRGLK